MRKSVEEMKDIGSLLMKQINLSSASSNANDETSVDYRRRNHMDL